MTLKSEAIARQVERAMLMIPHPHPHGGHPQNCGRCFAQGKLIELVTELVSAATTEAREAERAEIALMLETGRDIGHEVCALQFARRIRARSENKI